MVAIGYIMRVMIASPGDIPSHREAVEEAIHEWNNVNAIRQQVILLPWRWETSAVPQLGDHPQALLNKQGVDESDIVIALFGSRLGSPTPNAVSGTAEEIERATKAGTPVHLFFSGQPHPSDVDVDQLVALRQFKKEIQSRGLYLEYIQLGELKQKILAALSADVGSAYLGELPVRPRRQPAHFKASTYWTPGVETEEVIFIQNIGGHAAANVFVEELTGQWQSVPGKVRGENIDIQQEGKWIISRTGEDSLEVTYRIRVDWYDDWTNRRMHQELVVVGEPIPEPLPYPNYNLAYEDE